jgi:hypothetical protein
VSILPLDSEESDSIEVQKSAVIRANYLLFSGLAALSMQNACLPLLLLGEGYPHFFLPVYGENNCFNGFFLTVATGRSFCEG